MNTRLCFISTPKVRIPGTPSALSKYFIAFGLLAILTVNGQAETTDPGPVDQCLAGAKPLLSVADFNGDGIVNNSDLLLMGKVLKEGGYMAFFDRNADGKLNLADLESANQDLGLSSNALDQEITEVYWSTVKYSTLGKSALAGYVPATPNVPGHGVHWIQPFTFAQSAYPNEPARSNPEGLNYSTQGTLQAVYWGQPAATDSNGNIISDPPEGFFSAQYANEPIHWHKHEQGCFINLGFIDYVHFQQGVPATQCLQRQGLADGIPVSFYMMHLWLYYLNPNGAFATTHPCAGKVTPN